MNIVITGSKGFIGKKLVERLEKINKYNIYSIDIHNLDLTKREEVMNSEYFRLADCIICCHALNPKVEKNFLSSKSCFDDCDLIMDYLKVNTISLNYIVESTLSRYKKNKNSKIPSLIYLSSIYSKRSPKHFLYKDTSKTPWYGASKAASDYLIKYFAAKYFGKLNLNSIILGGVKKGNENLEFIKEYSKNSPSNSMLSINEILEYIESLINNPLPISSSGSEIILDGGWLLW